MKKYLLICFLLTMVVSSSLKSQDYHFSQFFDTPLLVNPSQTGVFNGDQRAVLFYRNQWATIMNPYKTFGFSFDSRVWKNGSETGYLALGLTAVKDKAGASELSLTQALVSVAYHQQVGSNSVISSGIQGGFSQHTVNQANLQWHNQYDPAQMGFDPSIPSGEIYEYDGFAHADVSAGILYSFSSATSTMSSNDGVRLNIGGAYYHFNRPKKSFTELFDHKLHSKMVVHGRAIMGIFNTNTALAPSFLYQSQGPNQEIIAGLGLRFMLTEQSRYTGFVKESALTIGSLLRVNDAIIPYIGLEVSNYAIGVSYDTNVGGLRRATNGVGGFEVNLRYVNPSPFRSQNRSFY